MNFFVLIFPLVVGTISSRKVGLFLNETIYWCPSERVCYRREIRCTEREVCRYEKNADGCFKDEWYHPRAHSVLIGRARLVSAKEWSSWYSRYEHQFLQYRGFTYEYGSKGVYVRDINDKFFFYRRTNRDFSFIGEGLVIVGHSYCTHNEIREFATIWEMFPYQGFINNCKDFVDALKSFLTTGFCSVKRRTTARDFLEKARLSSLVVISNRKWWKPVLQNEEMSHTPQTMTANITSKILCDSH